MDAESGVQLSVRKRQRDDGNDENSSAQQKKQRQPALTDAQKRIRKAFGTLDMQSQEGQAVLQASSRNEKLIDHNARVERDRLFDAYEKKEHLVELMEKVIKRINRFFSLREIFIQEGSIVLSLR